MWVNVTQFTGQVAVLMFTASWFDQGFKIGHMQHSRLHHFISYAPQNSVPLMQHIAADNFYFFSSVVEFPLLVPSVCALCRHHWCFWWSVMFIFLPPSVFSDEQLIFQTKCSTRLPDVSFFMYQKLFSPVLCSSYESEFDVMHWFYWA